jgi:AcrR family transcriptional regulator
LHYFGSKEELFAEVLRVRDERSASGSDSLLDAFSGVMRRNADVPGLAHLYASLSSDAVDPGHPAHEFFVERYERLRATLREELVQSQRDGAVDRALDPEVLARMLVALADGVQVQWLYGRDFSMEEQIDALLTLISGFRGTR